MIIKTNNKDEKFYQYMGKFFGSRLVEKQINDRIYDDDKKDWYLYLENDAVVAFASIQNKTIKNVYCYKDEYLEEIFKLIKNEEQINSSILTKRYIDIYLRSGFEVLDDKSYKNFVTISKKEEVKEK